MFTGVMISEAVLPQLGLSFERGVTWRMLHSLSADLSLFLLGLHLALHWKWIYTFTRRYLWEPLKTLGARRSQPAPVKVQVLEDR